VCLRYHVSPDVVQFDLAPCTVRTIRVDLEMVARNLIDNAIKYADDEQPQIEIVVRPEGEAHAIMRISDNGRGIPPSQRRRIFGRFVRLGSELVRDKPGMGLGLYIVQTLVTRLGGSVNIVDRERGKSGTTFEVRLPGRVVGAAGLANEVPEPTPAGLTDAPGP
jgi:signal transduction histidine kinase